MAPAGDESSPLPPNLVRAEFTPAELTTDQKGKDEAGWFRRNLSWKPSREGVEIGGTIIDILLRVGMSVAFLALAWWWLWGVSRIIDKQCEADSSKHLSDAVLIALLTTTTINVLGLLYFVANYLFPKQVSSKKDAAPSSPPAPPSLSDPPR